MAALHPVQLVCPGCRTRVHLPMTVAYADSPSETHTVAVRVGIDTAPLEKHLTNDCPRRPGATP